MKSIETKTKKTQPGMSKRSNPLSLDKVTETKEVTRALPKKKPVENTPSTTIIETLQGPKQLSIFLPLFNQALVETIKAQYPTLTYVQLIEKAWLRLLADEKPTAYKTLVAQGEKEGKE